MFSGLIRIDIMMAKVVIKNEKNNRKYFKSMKTELIIYTRKLKPSNILKKNVTLMNARRTRIH